MPIRIAIVAASIALGADAPPAPAPAPVTAQPPAAPAPTPRDAARPEEGHGAVRTPDLVTRVGGDRDIAVEVRRGVYVCGRSSIESPLPDGYPEPTPPGAIDVKRYPSVRRAEFRQESSKGLNVRMNVGFWPLFNHISRHEIPMTSPVEIEFDGVFKDLVALEPQADGAWTMSFLYRAKELGPAGSDGPVKVVDTEPVTVVSAGVSGPYGMETLRSGLALLRPWLAGQSEWEAAGEPRLFHYNGPSVPERDKWSEVQVPLRRKPAAAAAEGSAQSTPAPSR